MLIADIGGGIGWTSAIIAKHPRVKKVYLVEPSLIGEKDSNMFANILKLIHRKLK